MADSNLRRKRAKWARNSATGAVGQAAAAEKNRQHKVRACIVQALSRLGIPYGEWPDFVQVYYTRAQDQNHYRQLISLSPFQPPAFDRLNQSKEEWVKTADKAWEQHRNKFLQGCKYWIKVNVDEEIPQAKRTRGPGIELGATRAGRKRGANAPLDQRYEWTARHLVGVPLKEIAGADADASTVGKIVREILRRAGWARRPKSKSGPPRSVAEVSRL